MFPRTIVSVAALTLLAASVTACGGSSGKSAGSSPKTLTYWASNQGTSLANDKQVLAPELAKFTKQTGIKVNLEVIGWPDLLNQHHGRGHLGPGPRRAEHRQHLVGLAAGHRRVPAVRRLDAEPRSAARAGSSAEPRRHRRRRQAPHRRPALRQGLRPLLQQEDVRRRRHRRPADHLGRARRRRQEADPRQAVRPRLEAGSHTENAHFAFIFGAAAGRHAVRLRRQAAPRLRPGGRRRQAVRRPDGGRQDRQPVGRGVRQRHRRPRPTSPPARPR